MGGEFLSDRLEMNSYSSWEGVISKLTEGMRRDNKPCNKREVPSGTYLRMTLRLL